MLLLKCRSIDDLSSAVCLSVCLFVSCKAVGWVKLMFHERHFKTARFQVAKKKYKNGNVGRTVLPCRRLPEADKFEAGTSQKLEVLTTTRLMTPVFSDMTPSHWADSYQGFEETQDLYLQRSTGLRRQSGSFETSNVDCLGTRCHAPCGRLDPSSEVALCTNRIWHFPILKQNTLS